MNSAASDPLNDAPAPRTGQSPVVLALGGMMAMAVAMGIGRFVYTPLLPDLMEGLGLSIAQAGTIASANYLGYLIGAILAGLGWATGRERPVFVAALAATVMLLALMPLGQGAAVLSVIRFLAGIASAFAMIFGSAILFSHLDVAKRNDLQAVHFGGVGVGLALSAVLLIVLIQLDSEWRAGWIAAAAVALFGTVISAFLIRSGPAIPVGATQKEPGLRWSAPFTLITIAYGLFGIGYIVTATFLVAIVRGGYGQSVLEGWVWLVTGLAAAPSVFFWAPVRRRLGLVAVFAFGCIVEAIGVAASVLLPVPVGPFIGGILLGGTFVATTAYGLQIGRILAPEAPRQALAVMTASFGTGQIVGPLVAAHLTERTGDFVLGSLFAAFALVLAMVFAILTRAYRRGTQL